MEDYTDYHRYSWSVVKPRPRPVIIFLSRLPWYLVILALIHLTYTLQFFKEMDTGARILIFSVITLASFGLVVIFDRILNQIEKSKGPQLIHYRIDRQGIRINNRRYPHLSNVVLHYPDATVQEKAVTTLTYYQKQLK